MKKIIFVIFSSLILGGLLSVAHADQVGEICDRQAKSLSLQGEAYAKFLVACRRNYSNPAPKAGSPLPNQKTLDNIIDSERRL